MNNVTRINGFIDLDELCKSPEFRNIPWKTNESSVEEYGYSNVQYIFIYNNEIWIYKYVGESFSYAELVAEELAKCFSLPTAHYDLAFAKQYGKGVISRNFKLKNASYIKGHTILSDYIKAVLKINDTKKFEDEVKKHNSLEGIWNALEWYYRNNHNKSEIVQKLMGQIVNMFIYDMITGNTDRHEYNWGIVENEEEINLQPLFDNERILYFDSDFRMNPHIESEKNAFLEFTKQVEKIILEFISVSGSEYLIKIQEKLLLIEKENLSKIFLEIEKRTESPIPEHIKEEFYDRFQIIQKIIKATIYKYKRDRKLKEFYGNFQAIKNSIETSIDNYKENRKL